jgi:hypothetical protein
MLFFDHLSITPYKIFCQIQDLSFIGSTQAIYLNTRTETTAQSQCVCTADCTKYYNMLVFSHAAHDCQIRSNLYKQSENTGTDFDCTEIKGESVIEMSGKYDFTVTREVIEMMEAEAKLLLIGHTIIK